MSAMKILTLGVGILTATVGYAMHDGEFLHRLDTEFASPFVEWAKPLKNPPRALVMTQPGYDSRSVVELMQRMDIQCSAFMSMGTDKVWADDIYTAAVSGTGQRDKVKELMGLLKQDYPVYVLANLSLGALPREAVYLISRQIAENGAALIVTGGDYHLYPYVRNLTGLPYPEGQREIMSMVDKAALSAGAYSDDPKKAVDRSPVKTFQFGRGRIAVMSYDKGALGLFPKQPFCREWQARFECDTALFQRTILWAMGRQPEVKASCVQNVKGGTNGFVQSLLAENGLVFHLTGKAGVGGEGLFRLRDQDGRIAWSRSIPFTMGDEGVLVTARPPWLAPGDYFMDVIITRERKVDNIGVFMVTVESPLGLTSLSTDQDSYRAKDMIKVELSTERPAKEPMQLRWRLIDTANGAVWRQASVRVSAGQKFVVAIGPHPVPAMAAYLDCELVVADQVCARASKLLYFPQKGLPVYYSYVWDGVADFLPFTGRLLGDKAGFDAVLTSDPRACPQNVGMGVVQYCAHINFGYDEKRDCSRWDMVWNLFKKGEKASEIYGNDQTFYNPRARERVEGAFRAWVKDYHKYGVQVYNLGDENVFSYDAGFSPSDLKPFRDFEQARYGSIEKLNAAWGSHYQAFDEVEHLRMKDALAKRNYAAWMDHRAFVEHTYAEIHRFYSRIIKEYDPDAIVGAEGSSYGDLEKTIRDLEFWGPYSDPVGNELTRCLGGGKLRTVWWGGYVGSHGGRNPYPFYLWTPLLLGAVNGSAWFAGNTCAEGLTSAGLGFAKFFKTLLPHLDALKEGEAQLLINTPLKNDGIAILWSHESDSASLIGTQFQNPKDSFCTFLQYCYGRGLQSDILTPSMIAKDALKNYKILFLFGASSISDKTADSIRAFVEKGGIVVADVNPGVMDEFCRLREESVLAPLFGVQGIKAWKTPEPRKLDISRDIGGQRIVFRAERVLSSPETDVMMSGSCGKGFALMLNFGLGAAAQSASPATPFDGLMSGILAVAGVKPAATLTGLNPERTVFRVRSTKEFDLVGWVDSDPADQTRKATVKWGAKRHVYEVGKGYLGECDQWDASMETPFKLFCLFAKKQDAPPLTFASGTVKPGVPLRLDLSLVPANAVLRLEILCPDGSRFWPHPEVIVHDGKKRNYEIWFPYNGRFGDYTCIMTDVRTGLKTEKHFALQGE